MTAPEGFAVLTWLEAQIAEDEQVAQRENTYPRGEPITREDWERVAGDADSTLVSMFSPARVLAECTLKRVLLAPHVPRGVQGPPPYRWTCRACDDAPVAWEAYLSWPCTPVRQMTAVYTDREGYDPAWAPEEARA